MGDPSTSSGSRNSSVFLELVQKLKDIPQPECSQRRSRPTSTDADGTAQCMSCKDCKYADKLNDMREQAEYINSTIVKMSNFGDVLEKHMEQLDLSGINLVGEQNFEQLVCAVEHFRFQLPCTSFYEFSRNENPSGDIEDALSEQYDRLELFHKRCLLNCSVFSGDFKKRVLINWWIGEGLLKGNEMSLEEEGKQILDILEKSKFIVPLPKREGHPPNTWRMEPSVRGFVNAKWYEQLNKAVLLRSDAQIDVVDTSRVETVLNVNKSTVGSHESHILAYMGSLQVLHLGRSHPHQHVQVKALKYILEGLRKMKQLRLLNLEGISSISKLPVSGSLRETLLMPTSLMVLVLRGCQSLELLPSSIGGLKNLRHLDLSDCYILRKMPKEIRLLSKLEVLKGFVIGDKGSSSLEGLGLLKKLHKLSICVSKADFPQHPDLVNLANIEGLLRLKILWRIIASQQNQGNADSVQNENKQTTEIASQQSQGNVNSPQNEQTTEIGSQQSQGNVNSPQNEQTTEIGSQQNQGNADSVQNEQTTEIASQHNQSNVDSLQNEQNERSQRNQGNANSVQNEQTGQTSEIASQQNQSNVDSLQNEQTGKSIEIASQQDQGDADSVQNEKTTEIATQQNQGNVDSLPNEQTTKIASQQDLGDASSVQNEQTAETASRQNQGDADSLQYEQTEQTIEIASQQDQTDTDSNQNEQTIEIASQQNQGNVDSLQNEQTTEIASQQDQVDADSVPMEQTTEIASQQDQVDADSVQIEQTTEIASQQNHGNVDSLPIEQTEHTTEISEVPQIEGAPNNANSGEQAQDNPVLINPGKTSGARRLFSCFFGNQMVSSENADVFKKLEKLDLWCAPACAGAVLLDPQRFPSLMQLYIRGAAFHNLPTTNPWPELKKLRLLFLTHFHMEWEELNSLFPELSNLEMQSCPSLVEFLQHCNEKGVWLKP